MFACVRVCVCGGRMGKPSRPRLSGAHKSVAPPYFWPHPPPSPPSSCNNHPSPQVTRPRSLPDTTKAESLGKSCARHCSMAVRKTRTLFRLLHVHWCGATQSLVRPFVLGKHYCITGAFKSDEANAVGYAIAYSSTRSPDKLHNLPGSLRGGLERAKCPISYP